MEEEIINIDEFLPIGDGSTETKKPSMFKKQEDFDSSFLEEEPKKEEEPSEEEETFDEVIKKSDEAPTEEEEQEEQSKGLSKKFSKLVEKGVLIPFDDDKSLDDYSEKDWQELIEANFEEKQKEIKDATQKEFYDSLPDELQQAAKYVENGGRDLKSLFKVLAESQEITDLDPTVEEDQEIILRQFLSATNFGSSEDINEQLESWKETGQMEKWAKKNKPKLDKMYSSVVEDRLKAQEKYKEEQIKRKDLYLDNIHKTLKTGELNGIKLDAKKQKYFWEEMTTAKYESLSGKSTNLLGHLLEKYQFGDEPRYDLITEALWLLQDPEGYKEELTKNKVKDVNNKTLRTLKTEQNRKTTSSSQEFVEDEEPKKKRLSRQPKNIFSRN